MAKLHHIRQLAVKLESTPGTPATGLNAADLVRVRELTLTQNAQYFDRNVHTRSFGYTPRRQENSMCELTFAVEIAGHTDNEGNFTSPTAPIWGELLRACAFKEVAVFNTGVSSGTITGGPLQHGETLTGGTSTETATLVGTYFTGETTVYHEAASGAFTSAETITGGTSSGSFTQSSADGDAQAGYAWYPDTDSTDTVTIELRNDGDRITVYGCRGDVTIDCQSQDIALLRFTIQGIYSATTTASLLDDTLATAYPNQVPPTFVNAALGLTASAGTGDWASTDINFTEAQFTTGNNVVMRQNSNSSSGWLAAHIANRTPNGRFNPDDPTVATYNIREKFAEQTRYQVQCDWGTTVGNTFRVHCPSIELDSVGDGERDEVQSLDLSFRITRGFESGAASQNPGDDNELILFNL